MQNDTQPPYASGRVFQALLALVRSAGIEVQFAQIPAYVYARSRDRLIQMPEDNRFQSEAHAAIVLGHELAHSFVNEQRPQPDDEHPEMASRMLIEAECDLLGSYFYQLAKRIAQEQQAAVEASVRSETREKSGE